MTVSASLQTSGTESEPRANLHRHWHALHAAEAVAAVETDAVSGLSTEEARRRLDRFGENTLREPARRSLASVFVHQFKSPLIYLLFVAAGIALALGHTRDAAVIFVVLLLNAMIGTLHEGRAARALEALRRLATHKARVVRGGQELVVDARELVPGDIVFLEAGDAVAADARLLDGPSLQIAEAALTGESVPVGCAAPVIGRWDRSGLEQVVTSLLTNAIKFGPGKPIEIRIDRIDGHARLIVTDHGIGIDPARRPYVFERFERAVPSASYGGLGLGLYIARSIVLAHGGTITVDSMPGEGSTFTVTLPAVWRGAIHG